MSVGSAGGTSSVPTDGKCVDPSTSLGMTHLFCAGTIWVPAYRKCVDPSTSLGMTFLFLRRNQPASLAAPHSKPVISSEAQRSREILALAGTKVSVGSAGGTSSVPTDGKCVDPSTPLGMTHLFCAGTIWVLAYRKCVDPSTSLGMTHLFCAGTIWVPAYRKCVDPSTSLGMTHLFCAGTIWVPAYRKCVDPSASLGMTFLFLPRNHLGACLWEVRRSE